MSTRPRSALVPSPTPDRMHMAMHNTRIPFASERIPQTHTAAPSGAFHPPPASHHRPSSAIHQHTSDSPGAVDRAYVPVDERLVGVREGIANLSVTLQHDLDAKRQYEETRIYELRQVTEKIERHLALEVKRRTDSDRAIQTLVEKRMQELTETLERNITQKMLHFQRDLDVVTRKLEHTSKELAVEREKNHRLTEELRQQYTDGFEGLQRSFEQERAQRLEKEAMLLRRLSEDVHRLVERVDVEHHTRESSLQKMREQLHRMASGDGGDQTNGEKFRVHVLEEVMCLKNALRLETEAREQGEASLASTMQELVMQVQAGLRFIPS